MAIFLEFEGSNCSRYNNALHAAYHQSQEQILSSFIGDVIAQMHISEERRSQYSEIVDELVDRTRVTQASVQTETTTNLDVERDRLLSVLFFLVSTGLLSAKAAEKSAAKLLDIALRPYKGIQGNADDAETMLIDGLLKDLRSEGNSAAVTTLRLEEILEQLEEANNAFRVAKKQRIMAKNTKFLKISTNELRVLADNLLRELQDLIRATGIIAAEDAEKVADVELVSETIQEMNAMTRNYKTSFNQSEAQKKANKEKGDLELKPAEREEEEENKTL